MTIAVFDVNIAGNSTANVMSYLQDEVTFDNVSGIADIFMIT